MSGAINHAVIPGSHFATRWLLALLLFLCAAAASAQQVRLVELQGAIGPASADFVIRSLEEAADTGAALVVLRIDTPGGLDLAMRDIIRSILASPVPVAGWVAPGGARAASAGTYIMYASHFAAMAQATNIGSSTPVSLGGGGSPCPACPNHHLTKATILPLRTPPKLCPVRLWNERF